MNTIRKRPHDTLASEMETYHALGYRVVAVLHDEYVWHKNPNLADLLSYGGRNVIFHKVGLNLRCNANTLIVDKASDCDQAVIEFNECEHCNMFVRQGLLAHGVRLQADRVIWLGPCGEEGTNQFATYVQSLNRGTIDTLKFTLP